MGRALIITGIVVLAAGLLIEFGGRIPPIGRLPGDIVIRREQYTVYFPIVSGIVISVVLTIVINLIARFFR